MLKKTIITLRDLDPSKKMGGIGNYYTCISQYLNNQTLYHYIGKRNEDTFPLPLRLASDYIKLWRKLYEFNVLLVNPSLQKNCIYRDGISSYLSRFRKKKLIVFFRGWDLNIQKNIDRQSIVHYWVKNTFLKADHIIILSDIFKRKLRDWGYEKSISIESTLVDETYLNGIYNRNDTNNIVYLGNFSKAKGVWEVVKSLEYLISQDNSNIALTLAGDGTEHSSLKKYIEEKDIPVEITGYVRGKQKTEVYKNAQIYVFPSHHSEGMPNSIIEAMAFGLPVITTRVGGIQDFFIDGKMGLYLDNRNPEHIAEKIRYLLDRPLLMKQISSYNHNFARKYFYAGRVAKRLERIIEDVAEGRARDTVWWDEKYWGERIGE